MGMGMGMVAMEGCCEREGRLTSAVVRICALRAVQSVQLESGLRKNGTCLYMLKRIL